MTWCLPAFALGFALLTIFRQKKVFTIEINFTYKVEALKNLLLYFHISLQRLRFIVAVVNLGVCEHITFYVKPQQRVVIQKPVLLIVDDLGQPFLIFGRQSVEIIDHQ